MQETKEFKPYFLLIRNTKNFKEKCSINLTTKEYIHLKLYKIDNKDAPKPKEVGARLDVYLQGTTTMKMDFQSYDIAKEIITQQLTQYAQRNKRS